MNKIGPIVGSLVGILVLAVVGIWLWKVRRNRLDRHYGGKLDLVELWPVAPFDPSHVEDSSGSLAATHANPPLIEPAQESTAAQDHTISPVKARESGSMLSNPPFSQVRNNIPSTSTHVLSNTEMNLDADRLPRSEVMGLRAEMEDLREAFRQIQYGQIEPGAPLSINQSKETTRMPFLILVLYEMSMVRRKRTIMDFGGP